MATSNDQTQLVGLFKDSWGTDLIELFKFQAPLLNKVPFETANMIGNYFHQPIDLQFEHGWTYGAAGTNVTLAGATAGVTADMQIQGNQLYGQAQVNYEAMMRSATDKQAVKQATKTVVKRMGSSGTRRLEHQFLHGQRGLGIAGSLATESGSYTTVVTISDASWSGIWAGMEGAKVDIYSAVGGTQRNLVSAAALAVTISAVSIANKTITLSYGTARSGWDSTFAANDVIYFKGASSTTEFAGLDVIARNTGTLFNISATTYSLWGGNVYSTSTGTLSMAKLLDALSMAASYGLNGMRATAVVSPKAFEVLNTDQAALRKYDVSYRPAKAESGAEALVYHAQTGELEILPHWAQKDGMAHIFVPDETHRIGASDLGFVIRGGNPPQLILESATTAASEMRMQSHQAIWVEFPRHTVVLDGITYA